MRPPSYSARPKFDIALHSPTDRPRRRTRAAIEWFVSYQYLEVPISTLSQARLHASVLLLCGILFLRLRSGEPPFRVNDAAPDSASSWAVRSAASQAGIFLRSICSLWCYGILCKHVLPLSPASFFLGGFVFAFFVDYQRRIGDRMCCTTIPFSSFQPPEKRPQPHCCSGCLLVTCFCAALALVAFIRFFCDCFIITSGHVCENAV